MEILSKEILKNLEKKMSQAKELMLIKFCDIRTGKANPNILDKIIVNYYNSNIPLKNISTINVFEGNQIHIKPFDPASIPDIEKTILMSNLGITPQNDGLIVKLIFPQPTEEKRKNLIKEVDKIKEQTKIIIRNIRRQCNEEIKNIKLNKDLEKFLLRDVQNLSDKFIKLIENETIQKNNELLKI